MNNDSNKLISKRNKQRNKLNQVAVAKAKLENARLELLNRVKALEDWQQKMITGKDEETKFNMSMMFSLNGVANAIIEKNILSLSDLEQGRKDAVKEYFDEVKCQQQQAQAQPQTPPQEPPEATGPQEQPQTSQEPIGSSQAPTEAENLEV